MTKYFPILWIALLSLISIQLQQPLAVKPADSAGFSAISAMGHISIMASEIHMSGTKENKKVKNYILSEFAKLDIPTEEFIGHTKHSWGTGYVRLGRTENIIATIKGKSSDKAVMVVGHYDSVISSPGAADDVHSVACILEVAKLLKDAEHENDIIFLITDGEEQGLLGAKAFTETRDVSNIGLVLNYEARGNSGASISFEWSDGNAWLVNQLRKVAHRPIANSMSFEIYKNLPNDTDFTFFKEAGLSGINHAFIDGFSYYHNPADTPENINQNSVQHTGENMYLLTKHFANTDISKTKTHNATFFNFFGFLIIYPSSWDIFLLIGLLGFVGYVLFLSFRHKNVSVKTFFISFALIIFSVLICLLVVYGLSKLLFMLYPQYNVFYAGQFYNHKWYIWVCIGITLIVNALILKGTYLKKHTESVKVAILLFLSLLTIVFFIYISTATYFLLYPTLTLAALVYLKIKVPSNSKGKFITYALSIIPFGIWLPSIILFFLAFSIVGLPLPTILICFIVFGSIILFDKLWTQTRIIEYVGALTIILGLFVAHLYSNPTEEKPLPSSLFYNYNVTTGEAKWATEDKQINIGNESFLKGATLSQIMLPQPRTYWNTKTSVEPHVSFPKIVIDTTQSNTVKVISDKEIYLTRLYLENTANVGALYINEQEVYTERNSDQSITVDAYAMITDSLKIRIVKKDESIQQNIKINSNFRSLPIADDLPVNVLRVDGFTDIIQEITF